MKNHKRAKEQFLEASKKAVTEYIKVIGINLSEETSSEKIKSFIEAKVEAIEGCKEILRFIQNDVNQSYLKNTIDSVLDKLWDAYDAITDALSDEIDDIGDNKYKASVQGKRKAFENSRIILESIKEFEEIQNGEKVVIKDGTTLKPKLIEGRASKM